MRKGTHWRISYYGSLDDGAIRYFQPMAAEVQCPLTFVVGVDGCGPGAADAAAKAIGLGNWGRSIMNAADTKTGPKSHRKLRRILLRAAGLR
jgi:hypothetical protein